MPISPDSTPRRARDLEIREVPEGFVVYDPARDRLHFLNGSATFVLECCDGATRVDELPGMLAAGFRLDADPVAEVDSCLARLLDEGLVTIGNPGAA
ncbi:MAG: PqqD family protein [Betaproteobacteria bacterium]|nr:PqqD family protein [Betaproteobacteria bacterium]